jgi:glycogen operon protein
VNAEGRTQRGNNNAYCQDNRVSWIDWEGADQDLARFVARLIELRRTHPALRRNRWFDGSLTATGDRDLAWLWRDGTEMTPARWEDSLSRCFGFQFGRLDVEEATILALFNGTGGDVEFTLPAAPGGRWTLVVDSATPAAVDAGALSAAVVPSRALLIFASAAMTEAERA